MINRYNESDQPIQFAIVVVALIMLLLGVILGLSIQLMEHQRQINLLLNSNSIMERNLERYYCPDAGAKFIGVRPMRDKMRPEVRRK